MDKSVCCYLKKNDCYLLLYRNKKERDVNHDKWIGVGGHIEKGETPDMAAIREIKEETNFDVRSLKCAGEVLFIYDDYQELMYLYEIDDFTGVIMPCDEGELRWIPIVDIYQYPMWEGDKLFLPKLINHEPYFKMTLVYRDDILLKVVDGIDIIDQSN